MVGRIRIATPDSVRPIKVIPVASVIKEDSRLVTTVYEGIRKTRRDFLNHRQLPSSQNRVRRCIPVVSKLFSFTEKQIVNDAGCKAIPQFYQRGLPVQLFPVR